MDLIDRYLVAVGRHLPPALQKDIIEELADSLRSEAEDRAQKAGRTLTDDDQAELLKNHGHPWLMASRYLPQQQLIGPALYPYYRQALVIVLFWVVLPLTIGGGALAAIYAQDSGHIWGRALSTAWNGCIYAVGIVTIVFSILERQHVRITALDKWSPSLLPEPQDARAVSRTESLFSLIATITFLMLWTDFVRLPAFFDYGGAPVRFVPDPVWTAVYVPVLISVLVSIATSFVDLMRPWRTRMFSVLIILNGLAAAAILAFVLRAGHWVVIVGAPAVAENVTRADRWINLSIQWTLIIIAAGAVTEALRELWQVLTSRGEAAV